MSSFSAVSGPHPAITSAGLTVDGLRDLLRRDRDLMPTIQAGVRQIYYKIRDEEENADHLANSADMIDVYQEMNTVRMRKLQPPVLAIEGQKVLGNEDIELLQQLVQRLVGTYTCALNLSVLQLFRFHLCIQKRMFVLTDRDRYEPSGFGSEVTDATIEGWDPSPWPYLHQLLTFHIFAPERRFQETLEKFKTRASPEPGLLCLSQLPPAKDMKLSTLLEKTYSILCELGTRDPLEHSEAERQLFALHSNIALDLKQIDRVRLSKAPHQNQDDDLPWVLKSSDYLI